MTTNRDLLDREIGTPPPSTIDIDALIGRQRRLVRLRQTGIGLSTAAMTLAVGAVLVFVPRAGEAPEKVGASPTKVSIPPAPDPRKAEATRLTEALQSLVEQAFPGATFAKAPVSMPGERPADPLKFVDHGTYFSAAAVVTDTAGTGTISISVGKESTQFRMDRECMSGPYPKDVKFQCDVTSGEAGALIEKVTSDIGNSHFRRFYVEIIRADGNAVSIDVSNGVIEGDDPYVARRTLPLLTMAQALTMAQEPSLATTLP